MEYWSFRIKATHMQECQRYTLLMGTSIDIIICELYVQLAYSALNCLFIHLLAGLVPFVMVSNTRTRPWPRTGALKYVCSAVLLQWCRRSEQEVSRPSLQMPACERLVPLPTGELNYSSDCVSRRSASSLNLLVRWDIGCPHSVIVRISCQSSCLNSFPTHVTSLLRPRLAFSTPVLKHLSSLAPFLNYSHNLLSAFALSLANRTL